MQHRCGSSKRALIDKWPIDKAMAEATELGFTSAAAEDFHDRLREGPPEIN